MCASTPLHETLPFDDGDSLYFDDDHLSVRGADLVSRTFDPLFEFRRDEP